MEFPKLILALGQKQMKLSSNRRLGNIHFLKYFARLINIVPVITLPKQRYSSGALISLLNKRSTRKDEIHSPTLGCALLNTLDAKCTSLRYYAMKTEYYEKGGQTDYRPNRQILRAKWGIITTMECNKHKPGLSCPLGCMAALCREKTGLGTD